MKDCVLELTVGERQTLLSLVPKTQDITTQRMMAKAVEAIDFSWSETKGIQQELEGIKIPLGTIPRDHPFNLRTTTVTIEEHARAHFAQELKNLNDKKEITQRHVSLWAKLVEGAVTTKPETGDSNGQ